METCATCNGNKKIVWEEYDYSSDQPEIIYEDCPKCVPVKKYEYYVTPSVEYTLSPTMAIIMLSLGIIVIGLTAACGIALLMGVR